jgi:uncharacterized protein YkwD
LVRAARENIGEGTTVDGTQQALLESPGHHANIMAKDVTHVGIGIVKKGAKGSQTLLVTQVFAAPIASQDPASARAVLTRKISDARRAAGVKPLPLHPLLEKLAQKHISDVGDDLDTADSKKIGEAVTGELQGTGISGVSVATTVFISPELYEPGGAVTSGQVRALGIATAPAKDAQGRPAIKALFLIGH